MRGAMIDRPVVLLLLSQAGISVVMPLALLGLMYLSGRKDLMDAYRPRPVEWFLLILIAIFTLLMSSQAIRGLAEDISTTWQ
jgi:Mn2+/Fe2+ NRAMP family transporter